MKRNTVAQDAVPAKHTVIHTDNTAKHPEIYTYNAKRRITQPTDTAKCAIVKYTNIAEPTFRRNGVLRYMIALLLIVFSFSLFAETIKLQSFENAPTDTWAYTANPATTVPYFWGRTTQPMGGATAQDGSWYWGSWLMEANETSISFANVALVPGTQHSLNFHYYSKNLSTTTDILKVCVEYDTGSEWNNWYSLLLNTQTWSLFSVNIPQSASTVRVKVFTQYMNPNMDKYVHWDSFSIKDEEAEFTAPIIYNTSVAQRIDGSGLVDISYDLFDANGDLCEIGLKLSSDGGNTFAYIPEPTNLSGEIGADIAPGIAKEIIWDAGAEGIDFDGDQYLLQFRADDGHLPLPEHFVFVEGGTFHNGVSSVTVSSFYLDKYQLTQADYQAVMGTNPASGYGEGSNYPVYNVTWFKAIEYCNRRSIQEELTPCYSYDSYGTNPDNWPSGWDSYNSSHAYVSCDWNTDCYRLPTEMEWMFAARGGNQSHNYTYSGSNDLDLVGWYEGNNNPNGTKPVGSKSPNELGLYDMSGNVWELIWDIHGPYPSGAQNNPTGAASGTGRISRGGYWLNNAIHCTVSSRSFSYPTDSGKSLGFRVCRIFP